MVTKKTLEKHLVQIRRIEAHREAGAEKKIRRLYKQLLKDLKQFIGYEYAELAEDGKLTFDILQRNGEYARFLEEVEQKISGISPYVSKEIKDTVSDMYELSYKGMQEAVAKATTNAELHTALNGLHAVTPEVLKRGVEKGLTDETLKKHWQDHIYSIKRDINLGLANGDRVETMAKRIAQNVETDYKKAIRIARTENHRIREAGFHDSATDIDNTLKEGLTDLRMVKVWKTMKDERVRPNRGRGKKPAKSGANHVVMEGVTVPVDEKFVLSDGNETTAPGQSGIANQDIHCRCYLSYDLMTDEEYYNQTGKHFKDK